MVDKKIGMMKGQLKLPNNICRTRIIKIFIGINSVFSRILVPIYYRILLLYYISSYKLYIKTNYNILKSSKGK